ncbi:MAG: phosphoribosylaminoimidazolesuccinocarboxamide synthase [Schaalia turicensis]|nr:phosphoribosylaminoimidazolesuccinocarboxamide synthase [Schaalia turicensis]
MAAMELPGWKHVSSGKVRDIYAPADQETPDRLLLVTSDRISAYDYILPSEIPGKGKVLNQLALWWMEQLRDVTENHVITAETDATDPLSVPAPLVGRSVVAKALNMIPIECVVRGYLTGSGLVEYKESGTVCDIALPEGLVEASRLETPIFTPAAKAELGDHDENISFGRAAEMVGEELASRLRDVSIALYEGAREIAAERGVIIADTKFEFGLDPATGNLVLGDEILTPDSSRFWPADQWQPGQITPSFDKQYVRDWLTSAESGWDKKSGENPPVLPESVVTATRDRYIEAFVRLTGEEPTL